MLYLITMFLCSICSKSFNRKDVVQRHLKEVHYGKKRIRHVNTPALQYVNIQPINYQSQQQQHHVTPYTQQYLQYTHLPTLPYREENMEIDGINYHQQPYLEYTNKPQIKYKSQNPTLQPSINYESQYTQPLTLMDRSNPNTQPVSKI